MVTQVQTISRKQPLAMSRMMSGNRRHYRRFRLNWPVVIKGVDRFDKAFQEICFLKNLSPAGACLSLSGSLSVGARIEMDVHTPLSRKRWLRYVGKVIHLANQAEAQVIGIRFESARPTFVPAAAVMRLRLSEGWPGLVH